MSGDRKVSFHWNATAHRRYDWWHDASLSKTLRTPGRHSGAGGTAFVGTGRPLTAQQVVDRIQKNAGVPPTTGMATMDVLTRYVVQPRTIAVFRNHSHPGAERRRHVL
jgi:hypothetical protein